MLGSLRGTSGNFIVALLVGTGTGEVFLFSGLSFVLVGLFFGGLRFLLFG